MGLILSSLRETEASLLSEITAAVGREVWGKYFNQEFWEFQLQLERAPRGQVGSMNGNLQPELTPKRQSYGWKPCMPPTDLPFTRRMGRHGAEVRSANTKGSRAFPPSGPRPQAMGAQLWWGGHPSHGVLWAPSPRASAGGRKCVTVAHLALRREEPTVEATDRGPKISHPARQPRSLQGFHRHSQGP